MSTASLLNWALQTGIAITALTGFILLIRRPFAQRFGAGVAYTLWALPVLRVFMPPVTLPVFKPEILPVTIAPGLTVPSPMPGSFQTGTVASTPNFPLLILTLWIGIAALWLTREAVRQRLYIRKLRAQSTTMSGPCALLAGKAMRAANLKTMPDIRISDTHTGPLVTGLRRPLIILPKNFETHFHPQQQYFALLHEITHIKRRDLWAAFAVLLFRALNWPNPLIHFAAHKFRVDQEAACDASVLKLIDANKNAHAYAETLVHAAKSVKNPTKTAPLGLTIYHPLKERLMMMTSTKLKTGYLTRATASALVLGAAAVTAPITLAAGPGQTEMAGKAKTTHISKQVIKSVEEVDGKEVKTHYEIITDENGTTAYSIDNTGARTEVDPDSIEMRGHMKRMHVKHGQNGAGDTDVFITEKGMDGYGQKKIRIVTKDGQHIEHDIESLTGEHSDGKVRVIVKEIEDGDQGSEKHVKVYNFSSSSDVDVKIDEGRYMTGRSGHSKAMVSAASGLLEGLDEDALSDKAKRKIAKARKALKEAEKALETEVK